MDIQKIISDLVAKLTGDSGLIKKFLADPGTAIKDLTGFEVNADQIKEIVAGVTKDLGENAGEAIAEGKGLLDKIKGIFGK